MGVPQKQTNAASFACWQASHAGKLRLGKLRLGKLRLGKLRLGKLRLLKLRILGRGEFVVQ